ncbi:hypothetical protein PVT68_10720 [Microbulbifer bruguierae]|uniref:Uncharacterized protein n=1 Tax=Microbulbifer bruguierae TaxID=3029061 RepID=A0ABY8NCT5_9GAMM|nr:hypothetical protein [Microbulbifer bruguierae]WGL15243.1 hypothetical protein PVT68_10720 [Microbulbifer bruguierae]
MLVLLFLIQEGTPTSSSKWAFDLYQVKELHAAQSDSPKLLIVAGSNSLFGIFSNELEENFNLPTTNFGIHAGLGLRYLLERSKRSLDKGDIVYLPLEYALYQDDYSPSAQLMDFLIARDPTYLHSLPLTQQILGYANVSFERLFEGLRGGSNTYQGRSSKIYNVSNVDTSGNQTNNSVEDAAAFTEKLSRLTPKDIGNGEISKYSREILHEYFEWAKENNICIIGAPPNLMKFDEYNSEEFVFFFENVKKFYNEENVTFSGDHNDYLFSRDFFFDTEYHLNKKGVALRTQLTISDLGENLSALCNLQPGEKLAGGGLLLN